MKAFLLTLLALFVAMVAANDQQVKREVGGSHGAGANGKMRRAPYQLDNDDDDDTPDKGVGSEKYPQVRARSSHRSSADSTSAPGDRHERSLSLYLSLGFSLGPCEQLYLASTLSPVTDGRSAPEQRTCDRAST